ncbi:hypothetical protein LTR62_007170 [Meristemomyces frigidus]|uniref:Uncharacterized protein n=1 Tax=Meristemomyces frigidus TaxID=1508187 RepID=A0AAN7TES1_9PEZI|nr:hypothetical protein LTR62_007170 [Meristemomyces frigidus]
MASHTNMSDSATSFADSQYDMVDDLSDISNDDHDTASLVSDEGLEGREEGELDEEVEVLQEDGEEQDVTEATVRGLQRPQAVHDPTDRLIDSYLSEDLQTPRQSVTTDALKPAQTSKAFGAPSVSHNVLFVAGHDMPEAEKTQICAKITSAMAGSPDASTVSVTILPPPPTTIAQKSAITYRDGDVSLHFHSCTDVKVGAYEEAKHDLQEYRFSLFHADRMFSCCHKLKNLTEDVLGTPSLTVIYDTPLYTDPSEQRKDWVCTALQAVKSFGTPVLIIRDSAADALLPTYDLYAEELLATENKELKILLSSKSERGLERSTSSTYTMPTPQDAWNEIWKNAAKIRLTGFDFLMVGVYVLVISMIVQVPSMINQHLSSSLLAETTVHRDVLSLYLDNLANATGATHSVNATYLVPEPVQTSTNFLGIKQYSSLNDTRFGVVEPNHLIVSLPRDFFVPSFSLEAIRGAAKVIVRGTSIVGSIYDIVIPPEEAHGNFGIFVPFSSRGEVTYIEHNFGNRMLQRRTYEQARTDLNNVVSKDLAIARDTAKSFRERMEIEVKAGSAATRNITTQLAVQMTRDLAIVVKAAGSAISRIDQYMNSTAALIIKDVGHLQASFADLGASIRNSFSAARNSTADELPTKKLITEPLKLSHERAVGFRQKLFGGAAKSKEETVNFAETKELSVRVKDWMISLVRPKMNFEDIYGPQQTTESKESNAQSKSYGCGESQPRIKGSRQASEERGKDVGKEKTVAGKKGKKGPVIVVATPMRAEL